MWVPDLKYLTLITTFSCLSWTVRGPIGKSKNWEITRAWGLNSSLCYMHVIFVLIIYKIHLPKLITIIKDEVIRVGPNLTWLVKVKVTQLCPTLCNPVHGLLQARILEWVAFPFSRGSFKPRDWTQVSHIAGGFFTNWATREAQESWSG